MKRTEWIATEWVRRSDFEARTSLRFSIVLMNSHSYPGKRYAVRFLGFCLNVDGQTEYEPLSSERDNDFYKRCRFKTMTQAKQVLAKFEKENPFYAKYQIYGKEVNIPEPPKGKIVHKMK